MNIKEGDLYSYATILIAEYGFIVHTNEDYSYPVALDDILGVEILIGRGGMDNDLNIRLQPENIGKVISDPRGKSHGSYILVYRAGKTEEQVLELVRPGMVELLEQRFQLFQELTTNAREMADIVSSEKFGTDYLCSSHPQSKTHG